MGAGATDFPSHEPHEQHLPTAKSFVLQRKPRNSPHLPAPAAWMRHSPPSTGARVPGSPALRSASSFCTRVLSRGTRVHGSGWRQERGELVSPQYGRKSPGHGRGAGQQPHGSSCKAQLQGSCAGAAAELRSRHLCCHLPSPLPS